MKKIIAFALAMIMAMSLCVGASARLTGDVDSSGRTTSADALIVLKYSVGLEKTINEKYADVNNDGKINSFDALDILKICVGTYTGELEINDDPVTLKSTVIDSVMKTKKFTVVTSVEENGENIPVTIMVDNNNMVTEMKYSGITMRVALLDGQVYCVLPKCPLLAGMTAYGKLVGGEEFSELGEFGTIEGLEFIKSEKVTVSGKTYTKETYKLAGRTEYSYTEYCYYFLGNEWKILETVTHTSTNNSGERVWAEDTEIQTIDSFKSGVDASYFKLTGIDLGEIDMNEFVG